jgi:tight adherence protein C
VTGPAARPRALDRFVLRAVVLVIGVAVVVSPLAAVACLWAAVAWRVWSWRAARRRDEALVIDLLPDLIDLFRLAVGAGCTAAEAVAAVQRRAPPRARTALREVMQAFERGASLADALVELPGQLGDPARPLAAGLARALRDGTPLLGALDRLGADSRRARRRQADLRARRLPVALLFPLVLCTLPAFALLTIAPLLLTSLHALQP